MRTLFLAVPIFFSCVLCLADGDSLSDSGRIRMTGPDPRKEIARDLVGELASHCNSRDFVQFMDGFTERHAGKIRERAKDNFLADDLRMDIEDVVLFSGDEESMEFGVKYEISVDGTTRSITSIVTARLDGSTWKIDSEKVKKCSKRGGLDSSMAGVPKPRGRVGAVAFEPAGRNNGVPANWDPMNPDPDLVDPNLRDMIGSGIGINPGSGCANGRCGVR